MDGGKTAGNGNTEAVTESKLPTTAEVPHTNPVLRSLWVRRIVEDDVGATESGVRRTMHTCSTKDRYELRKDTLDNRRGRLG